MVNANMSWRQKDLSAFSFRSTKFPNLRVNPALLAPPMLRPNGLVSLPLVGKYSSHNMLSDIMKPEHRANKPVSFSTVSGSADSGYSEGRHEHPHSPTSVHRGLPVASVFPDTSSKHQSFRSTLMKMSSIPRIEKLPDKFRRKSRNDFVFENDKAFTRTSRKDIEIAHLERLKEIRRRAISVQPDGFGHLSMSVSKISFKIRPDNIEVADKALQLGRGFATKLKSQSENVTEQTNTKQSRKLSMKTESAPAAVCTGSDADRHDHTTEKITFSRECTCTRLPSIPKQQTTTIKRRNSDLSMTRQNSDLMPKRRASDVGAVRLTRSNTVVLPPKQQPSKMKLTFIELKNALEPIAKTPDSFRREKSLLTPTPEPIVQIGLPAVPTPKPPPTPQPVKRKKHLGMNVSVGEEEFELLRSNFLRLDTDMDGHILINQLPEFLPPNLTQQQVEYLKQVYQVANMNTFFGIDEFITMNKLSSHLSNFNGPILEAYTKLNAVDVRKAIVKYSNIFLSLDENNEGEIRVRTFADMLCKLASCGVTEEEELLSRLCDDLAINDGETIGKLDYLVYIPYFLCLENEKGPKRGRSNSILDMEPIPIP